MNHDHGQVAVFQASYLIGPLKLYSLGDQHKWESFVQSRYLQRNLWNRKKCCKRTTILIYQKQAKTGFFLSRKDKQDTISQQYQIIQE